MGIPTYFLGEVDDTTFRARSMVMISIECVARRISTGSYLQRNPDADEGEIFEELILEFFLKDDDRHDPIMIAHIEDGKFDLYDAHQPLCAGVIDTTTFHEVLFTDDNKWCGGIIEQMLDITRQVFTTLEVA